MLIFIHNALPTSTRINFIFCSVYKVFCISVSFISKLVYSVILCSCINIIRIHLKKSKQMSKLGFFLSRSHVGLNSGFSSKTGRMPMKSEWLDSLYCKRRCQLLEILNLETLSFSPTQPTLPPNKLTQSPNGNAGFIQKIATIFQGLFKDHIRFSRTNY